MMHNPDVSDEWEFVGNYTAFSPDYGLNLEYGDCSFGDMYRQYTCKYGKESVRSAIAVNETGFPIDRETALYLKKGASPLPLWRRMWNRMTYPFRSIY